MLLTASTMLVIAALGGAVAVDVTALVIVAVVVLVSVATRPPSHSGRALALRVGRA